MFFPKSCYWVHPPSLAFGQRLILSCPYFKVTKFSRHAASLNRPVNGANSFHLSAIFGLKRYIALDWCFICFSLAYTIYILKIHKIN